MKESKKKTWEDRWSELISPFCKAPNIMSSEETVDYIAKNRASVARFGDGELDLIRNAGDLGFQGRNEKLSKRLLETANDKNLLVCIPRNIIKSVCETELNDYARQCWEKDIKKRLYFWSKYFKKGILYGDSTFTRFYMDKKDKSNCAEYAEKLKTIWQDREIVLIEGERSRLGVGNDLFDNTKSIERVLCPSENAFDCMDEIKEFVNSEVPRRKQLILALGPTATVMASDFAKAGFQAVDVGHVDVEYEWMRMGATEKVPVPSKYVNEAKIVVDGVRQGYKGTAEAKDEKYHSQIVKSFVKKEL